MEYTNKKIDEILENNPVPKKLVMAISTRGKDNFHKLLCVDQGWLKKQREKGNNWN